jgi:hypothetical protein
MPLVTPAAKEARIRLALAQQLQDSIRKEIEQDRWQFSAAQLSIVFVMPVDILMTMVSTDCHPSMVPFYDADWALECAAELVTHCKSSNLMLYLFL